MLVVTGASGLLGAAVLLQARELARPVAGLCHRHLLVLPDTSIHSVDLTDAEATRKVIASLRPSQIIHCAAATQVDWCEQHADQAKKMNTDLPVRLAQLALELGARFVYISTDAVFDGKRMNYTEGDATAPLNVYAKSKLGAEHGVLWQNPAAVVARVNIYGWNAQNKQSLAEWILSQLATGKPVPGFTDVYFTPILVNDLAEILFAALDRGLSGLYHIGGSERISKYEFAQRVAVEFGCNPDQVVPTSVKEAGLQAKRAPDMSMNTEKISTALGHSMPNIESGLRRFRELRDTGYPQRLKSYLHGAQG